MERKFGVKLSIGVILSALMSIAAFSQDGGPQTRSATSDAFRAKRPPAAAPANSRARPPRPSTKYRYVRTERNIAGSRPAAKSTTTAKPKTAQPDKTPKTLSEIGFTMWKLRPPAEGEAGFYIPVELSEGKVAQWLAERVGVNSRFKLEDRVRLAIESSVDGYLYIVNRETYSDGSVGDPYLIFPTAADGDNTVGPGLLFDIPDQRDEFPYFNVKPRDESKLSVYDGEHITIIISRRPLTGLDADPKTDKLLKTAALEKLEETAESELFERTDTEDRIFTKTEADSTCGATTRGLERQKSSGKSCGRAKYLSRDDAQPQTLFRVLTDANQTVVAFVKLAVEH